MSVMRIKSVVFAASLIVVAGRAHASPIGSVKWSYDVLLGTASAFSLSSCESSARVALLSPDESFVFQRSPRDLAAGAVQSLESLSRVVAPLDRNRTPLLISSVAAPLPPAFQEPSAWMIVLIGLGIVALGNIKRRRR
jgi:hypothetical protein